MAVKEEFDAAVRGADEWIDSLKPQLGGHDRERVYTVPLAILHALRDGRGRDEAVNLGACAQRVEPKDGSIRQTASGMLTHV